VWGGVTLVRRDSEVVARASRSGAEPLLASRIMRMLSLMPEPRRCGVLETELRYGFEFNAFTMDVDRVTVHLFVDKEPGPSIYLWGGRAELVGLDGSSRDVSGCSEVRAVLTAVAAIAAGDEATLARALGADRAEIVG